MSADLIPISAAQEEQDSAAIAAEFLYEQGQRSSLSAARSSRRASTSGSRHRPAGHPDTVARRLEQGADGGRPILLPGHGEPWRQGVADAVRLAQHP